MNKNNENNETFNFNNETFKNNLNYFKNYYYKKIYKYILYNCISNNEDVNMNAINPKYIIKIMNDINIINLFIKNIN
jgi:hypothetical protein